MNHKSPYWGELYPSPAVVASVSPSLTVVKNSQEVIVEGPKLIQPSVQQKTPAELIPAELCRPDILSLHTIQLMKYNQEMCISVSSHQHQSGDGHKSDDKKFDEPNLPSPPLLDDLRQLYPQQSRSNVDEYGRLCRFKVNKGSIEIDKSTARKLSYKAVATTCAHVGYDACRESAVETLTDVLNEFLGKVCQLLRVTVDREASTGCTGFQDPLSQVLQEIGIGPTSTLYTFWKKRIKNYHDVVQRRTATLQNRIRRHKNPSAVAVTTKCMMTDDEMPTQIFAESGSKQSGYDATLSIVRTIGEADHLPGDGSWYGTVPKMEPMERDESGEESNEQGNGEEEVIDCSSFVETSSDVVDVGSPSPWERYQDVSPPRKKKKK